MTAAPCDMSGRKDSKASTTSLRQSKAGPHSQLGMPKSSVRGSGMLLVPLKFTELPCHTFAHSYQKYSRSFASHIKATHTVIGVPPPWTVVNLHTTTPITSRSRGKSLRSMKMGCPHSKCFKDTSSAERGFLGQNSQCQGTGRKTLETSTYYSIS